MFFALMIGLIALWSCTPEKPESSPWESFQGVWASKDCELVRTAHYSLLFQRNGNILSSTLKKIKVEKNRIQVNTLAKAVFNNADQTAALKAKDLFEGNNIIIQHPPSNNLELQSHFYSIKEESAKISLFKEGQSMEELDTENNQLKIRQPDGKWETLTLIEKIEMTEPYDMSRDVTQENVGRRLQEWRLGTSCWKDPESPFWKIDIGTNQHLYTFTMNTDFLYCRAARIRSNNQGTVFSQNIRLVVRGENRDQGYIGYMPENNLEKAGSELVIDNSKFNAACGIAYDVDIYWSLNSFKDGEIKVNGCDQVYERHPSARDDEKMLEWIAFERY